MLAALKFNYLHIPLPVELLVDEYYDPRFRIQPCMHTANDELSDISQSIETDKLTTEFACLARPRL